VIKRYTPQEIGEVWTDQSKYQTWLDVELAVVSAKEKLGTYPSGTHQTISEVARFTVEEINELDKLIEHDLLAFVETVRKYLPSNQRSKFHEGLTSYDTEVPALALQFLRAGKIILRDLDSLIAAVRVKASMHIFTYCMGITHGQDAEPTTFGYRLCGYLEMLELCKENLINSLHQIEMAKCSGAVGNWATIAPDLESEILTKLSLRPRKVATQIVPRDVFARFLSEVAILGGCIEKIATDLRMLATTAYAEIEEPRKAKQKGSSAMPHKKNPILLERMCGMAILLRGYAAMGQEIIRTWLERDIAHSCVERIAFADATIVLDYMLQKMTWVMENLVVNRERMAQNIGRSYGCWASEQVKLLLCAKGIDPEAVYSYVQSCAFAAFKSRQQFHVVLEKTPLPSGDPLWFAVSEAELLGCFDFKKQLEELHYIVEGRMELDLRIALAANM
jgi:adenylosuccinate lyase